MEETVKVENNSARILLNFFKIATLHKVILRLKTYFFFGAQLHMGCSIK